MFRLMEIKVYGSFELRNIGKSMYCVRVATPDTFDYQKTIEVEGVFMVLIRLLKYYCLIFNYIFYEFCSGFFMI